MHRTDTDTRYNGWTNYATWRINLEIFDGRTVSDYAHGVDEAAELGPMLQEHTEELIESSTTAGLARDYAMAFLSDVDWREIAEHLIGEAEE